jgi:CRP-like cAMP-binding protein
MSGEDSGGGPSEIQIPGFEGMEGVEFIQQLPLFRSLSFDETRRLFSIAHGLDKAKGEVLIEQNGLGTALYIVRSGVVDVTRDEKSIGQCGVGELLGEMSLVDDVLTSSEVRAAEDCTFLAIDRRKFDELMDSDPPLAVKVYKAFCRTLSDRLRTANAHVPEDEALDSGVL